MLFGSRPCVSLAGRHSIGSRVPTRIVIAHRLGQTMNAPLEDLIPPMPPRLPADAGIWTKLMKSRANLIAGWTEDCFERKMFNFSILTQRYIVCNDAESVREVFLEKNHNFDPKAPQMRRALEPLLGDGLFVSDGELWRERRDACAPALRSEHLEDYVAQMASTTQDMAISWDAREGETIDVLDEMAHLTARIIGRTIFGDDTPEAEAREVVTGFSHYVRSIEQMDLASSLGLPSLEFMTNPFGAGKARRSAKRIHDVIDKIIARHKLQTLKDGSNKSLLAMFLSPPSDGSSTTCRFSDIAARNEAIVMFMAGHETTANTLTWAWYLLWASPDSRKQLQLELDNVLGDRLPTLQDVTNLPFTRAIIEETLRLYPPVPVLSRQARNDDTIKGKPVRRGDIILVVPWLLHRHDKHWEAPNAFRPQRFMAPAKRPDRFVYIPFSVGHRVCLGQRFGLTEAVLCLAMLAQRFELDLEPGREVEVSCRLTLRPKDGLPMTIRRRA